MSLYSMVTASRSSSLSSEWSSSQRRTANLQQAAPHLTRFHDRVVSEVKQKLARHEYRQAERSCPECRQAFVSIEVDGVLLEYCRDCRSWWFDAAELMHFTQLFEDIPDGDFADRGSQLPCPVCQQLLREQQLRVNSNLMVHTCPEKHGVFLEDGEFQRAMEVSDRVDQLAGHLNDQHLAVWRELQRCLATGEFTPSELSCLECGEDTVIVVLDDVAIDYCTQCQSCWFDAEELKHFTRQARDVPGDHLTSRPTSHSCPKCQLQMRLYQFHPRSNLTVEACPGRHGVYLQSGQFPQVLRASE